MTMDLVDQSLVTAEAPSPDAVLTVSRLTKTFAMHHLNRVLPGFGEVSFSLSAGEFLLLSGENGAGKSTLLRTLYRSYLPSGGAAVLRLGDGRTIDLARAADVDIVALRGREMGFVTQFLNARPRVSAEELVAEPLSLTDANGGEALREARRALSAFGLPEALWPAYPSTFSGGEQQKVNLARTLCRPPRLLLLDEPTASLDRSARAALVERLAAIKADGVAMIGVFHHPDDVATLIDRELRLARSAPVEDGHVVE